MNQTTKNTVKFWAAWMGVALLSLFIVASAACFFAYQEARAYNRLAQPEVEATTWDALFVELRVDK